MLYRNVLRMNIWCEGLALRKSKQDKNRNFFFVGMYTRIIT